MVKLICNFSTYNFCVDYPASETVENVTRQAAIVHNLRNQVNRLAAGVRELAKYGPMKSPDAQSLELEESLNNQCSVTLKHGADPLGHRIGQAPEGRLATVLNQCADEAEASVAESLAKSRTSIDVPKVKEYVQNIKGAVMMAYPMGLPEWDVVRQNLEDNEQLAGQEESKYVLDPDTCVLWFANKEMMRDEKLEKYSGRNDKCIIQVKFTSKGAGAPVRAPPVDEDTQKKMMAYWHKKQAENKSLVENDEDQYLHSAWANPKAFKNQMNGLSGDIRLR